MEHPDITRVNRDGELDSPEYEAVCAYCGLQAEAGGYILAHGRAFCSSPDCMKRAYTIYADRDLTEFAYEMDLTEEACFWWFRSNLMR